MIGIDRFIRLKWLEYTSDFVLAGNDEKAVKEELERLISSAFDCSSSSKRGSLSKTLTILLKTWVRVHPDIYSLRDSGLDLIQKTENTNHIAFHWGMITAAYPFWGAVAEQTGRLLRLQGNVTKNQIQRRLREQYGERETVSRTVGRVLQSFVDWSVLCETSGKGIYSQGCTYSVDNPKIISWLIEADLHRRSSGSASIRELLTCTSLFPFCLKQLPAEHLVAMSPRMNLLRHGLDDELVMLQDPENTSREF
ncbi:MAG: hypothetical protein GQ565_12555 [Candidatus Aegiribacteria sp.]|nr:hypothetical protein [Candidatus Aegiribacteria sp.]